MQARAHETNRACPYAFEFRMQLHEMEQLENGERLPFEHARAARFEKSVVRLKPAIQRNDFRFTAAKQFFFEMLQQDFVEQRELFDGAVVPLHELLNRERTR